MRFYGLPSIDVPGVKVSAHYAGPIVDPDDRPQSAGGGGAAPDAEDPRRSRAGRATLSVSAQLVWEE